MVLIKSATRRLCLLLGLLTGAFISFGHPSRRGWYELDRLQLGPDCQRGGDLVTLPWPFGHEPASNERCDPDLCLVGALRFFKPW
jgi:hypothetical protein